MRPMQTHALAGYIAGYIAAKTGRTVTFSVYFNDLREVVAATKAMDEAPALVRPRRTSARRESPRFQYFV